MQSHCNESGELIGIVGVVRMGLAIASIS